MSRVGSERLVDNPASGPDHDSRQCGSCGTTLPSDAVMCYGCGEFLSDPASAPMEESKTYKNLTRDRILFYLGVILVAGGGPGMVLGSLIHDLMRIPIIGHAYGAFGPVNSAFALFGFALLAFGVAFVIVSLRGGVLRAAPAQSRKGLREAPLLEAL